MAWIGCSAALADARSATFNRHALRLASVLLALISGGCSIAQDRACYTKRAAVVLPDRNKALANLTNGGSGRAVAEAILDGRIEDARAMLARDPRLLTTIVTHDPRMDRFPDGQYGDLLTFAVARCDAKAVDMLIEAGMSPNGAKSGGALSLALLADAPELAEQLLTLGASPDPQKLPGGQDALKEIMAFSHIGGVMTLLRHGADPRYTDEFGNDRVSDAVGTEQTEIAELLVQKGASLWTVMEDGSMAVHNLMKPPIIFDKPNFNAARERLVALAQDQAKAANLPWPPPDRDTVKRMILSGKWPTAAMIKVGMVPSPQARARMKTP
jgi:hypothetical protein